ncbi:MAG: PAS domain S-box protein [Flavobacteriales bacterium]|nr:PAS domain S-box protein [Flavobacteriales bacterium]MBS4042141.1 PAS domain S-box protein [Flavobacteriales bacterium]
MNDRDFSSLFYHNPLPNWIYDLHTFQILEVNESALTHYGYSREEFLSITIHDLLPKEEISNLLRGHEGVESKFGNIFFGFFTHKKKNETLIQVEVHGHQVHFNDHQAILVMVIDVTDKLLQFNNLKKSENWHKTAIDLAKVGQWKLDLKTKELTWSQEVYQLWDLNPNQDQIDFDLFLNSFFEEDKADFLNAQNQALAGIKPLDFIHRIKTNSGNIKWVHERGRLDSTNESSELSFSGTVQDITALKAEEQHLKLLERVIAHTSDSVVITEAEPQVFPGPRILFVNKAFTDLTGYIPEEVIGKTPRILQGPKTDKRVLEEMKLAMANWQPSEFTLLNYKKSGEEYWVNISLSPVADEKGWFTHWIAVERDVTKQILASREKDLLAKISHFFNQEKETTDALNFLCSEIAEFGNFDFTEVWLPTFDKENLRIAAFFANSNTGQNFYDQVENLSQIPLGDGLPGIIWKNQKAVIWDSVGVKSEFLRSVQARNTGIETVIGFPLLNGNEPVGVFVAGTTSSKLKVDFLKNSFQRLESFVGSEIARKKIENDFELLINSVPDLIGILDLSGKIIRINPAGCKILDYPEDEILNQNLDLFSYPIDKNNFRSKVLSLESSKQLFNFQGRFVTGSGDLVWLSWSCKIDRGNGIVLATAKDITTERKLSELLNNSSQLAKIGSWEINVSEGTVYWSDLVHQMHETDPQTYIPNLSDGINFYHPDFREMVERNVNQTLSSGAPFDFQALLVTAKENLFWVRVIGQAEMAEGKVVRVFGSFQDIHEQKEAEIRLKTITDDLPGVTFQYVIRPDGTDLLQSVSKGSKMIWDLSPEECQNDVNQVWDQVRAGGNFSKVVADLQNSITNMNHWHSRWRNILPNGKVRWHEGYGTPNQLPDGTIVFNSMVFDVTEEVVATELYNESSKLAKIGSWELNLKNVSGDSMFWSPIVREILEVDQDYNPSLSGGFEFYVGESRISITKAVDNLIAEQKPFDEELLVRTAKGNLKWIRCIGDGEFQHGKCIRIFGSYQDIHEKKSLELKLGEILGSISDAFYALDNNWSFTYFNREAELLLNSDSKAVLGKNIWEKFPAAKGTVLEEVYLRVSQSGKPENLEYFYPGNNCWYEINVYASQNGISVYFKNIDERRKASEDLQKAFKEKNQIIESIADAFFTMDRNFVVTYWNRSAEEMIGVVREQLLGKVLWDVFPDAVSLPSFNFYHQVLETGRPVTFEDNYGIWLEVNAYPSEEGLTVFFRDISLRKEADQRLQKAYEERNQILESIGDAFFAVDNDWIVTYWNRMAEEVLLKDKTEVIGKNLWELYQDSIDSEIYRMYHFAKSSGEMVSFEEHFKSLDKWFEVTAYPSPSGLSVYFKEITLRKQTELIIRQANERFEMVTQATTDAIWDWDIANDVFSRSKGFNELFGYEPKKTLKKVEFWTDSFFQEDKEKLKSSIDSALANPETKLWELEYRIVHASSKIKIVLDKGVIVRNEHGEAIRMVGAMSDISFQKEYEQELEKLNEELKRNIRNLEMANEDLEQFAFITSHDLQEPLRMITSFLDQLRRKYDDKLDSNAKQYIHFAVDGAKRMKQIILDLLEYSRAGRGEELDEEVSLSDVIDEFKILRKMLIEEKGVGIHYHSLPRLKVPKAPLVQTIHCLLDNAIKYSRDNIPPEIEVRAMEDNDGWTISIKDNGIGIDPNFYKKIFVIFQRLHVRGKYSGTGIGLALVKKQVESWGGKVWVESKIGVGSTFYFTITKY